MEISRNNFEALIKRVANKETSSELEHWTVENPLWGHCAVVALIAQDYFGGDLVRGSLKGTKYEILRSHYWNRFEDGSEIDYTKSQYPDLTYKDLGGEVRFREKVLEYPDTVRRYVLLKKRLENIL